MAVKLTEGAIETMMAGGQLDKPIMQILGSKKIPGGSQERYRLLLSDGKHSHSFAMLATQLNPRLLAGELDNFTVIRVDKYISNQVQNDKRVLIILEVTVLASGTDVGQRIGVPTGVLTQSNSDANNVNTPGTGVIKTNPNPMNASSNNNNRVQQQNKYNQSLSSNSSGWQKPSSTTGSTNNSWQQQRGGGNVSGSPGVGSSRVFPIESLTPYQNKWTIRARVTNKSSIRTWSNSRGEGKLFSVDLVDETGEIRATAFNDTCDKFYEVFEIGKVYFISNASLKSANKNFTNVRNDYEMSLRNDSTVEICTETCNDVPTMQYDFVPIAQLEEKQKDDIVDVIGICKSAGDVQTISSKNTGKEYKKRDIQLVDQTNKAIQISLWGEAAETFDDSTQPVLAVKGAKVSDFGGLSLSVMQQSVVAINPDIKEACILKGWFTREGGSMQIESLSGKGGSGGGPANWKFLSQVVTENLGMGDKPDYYTTKATVVLFKKENCMYQSCTTQSCNKKVIDLNNGMYRCEKCNRENDSFQWRLLLQVNLADFSGNQWVTCFQEGGEEILGMKADDLGKLRETNEAEFHAVFNRVTFNSFVFKLRSKMETYNDENRLKTTVYTVAPMNYCVYGRKLLEDLK